ncbi:glycosyltransferase [Patescibacteria group bacterium]|nr:glycosyltransferase [Patescibacteria group bacterium]
MNKISFIIPSYNGEALLKKNLPKVFEVISDFKEKNKIEVEIVVADDGSKDKSLEVLEAFKENFKELIIVKNTINKGFSSNVNSAVAKSSGEILILINTDVIPQKGFLEPLLKHFKDEKVFAVGCLEKSVENGEIILRGRGLGEWKRGLLIHRRGEVDKKNTLWVSGGSGAFRKSIWDKIGGLNTLYDPFYWEDIDLSYKAQKAGYSVLFEPESMVMHEHEKGTIKSGFSKFKVKKTAFRNQFTFVWLNLTDKDILIKHILLIPYYKIKALISLDFAFFMGLSDAWIRIPKILAERKKIQKIFVKKDKEVIKWIQ